MVYNYPDIPKKFVTNLNIGNYIFLSTKILKIILIGVLNRVVKYINYFFIPDLFFNLLHFKLPSSKIYYLNIDLQNKAMRLALIKLLFKNKIRFLMY